MEKQTKISSSDRLLILRLLQENFKKHILWYTGAILSMFLIAVTTSASAWIMRDVVEKIVGQHEFNSVMIVAAAVAVIFIVKGISSFLQIFFLSKAGNSIVAEQQRKIYSHLIAQGISFYQNMRSSDLLIRVTQNANAARDVIDTVATTFVRDFFSVIGLLGVMLIQNLTLSVITLGIGPLAFIAIRVILKQIRKLMTIELSSLAEIIRIMQETSSGIRVVKTFSLEKLMQKRMQKAIGDVERRANEIARLGAATSPVMETLAGLAIAVVIVFSGYMAIQEPGTGAQLMSFITALLLAYEPAKRLANVRVKLETGIVGVRMMFEILDHPITLTEDSNAVDLLPGLGEITFHNVEFSYVSDHPVIKNICLNFPSGKMTALVGPSGSGKSTVINLMMRLYDPTGGKITLDGQDIRQVTFYSLRRKISYVSQDTFLFEGSVYYNIALGNPNARAQEVFAAATAANAHNFILELENGYDTNIGDNGNNLSGGQRQRIAIARAILRNSEILILDEATSSLDSESESFIREALRRLSKGRTTIVIAHRFSTIASADKIVVMKEGCIIEEGSLRELLSQEEGLFKHFYTLQSQELDKQRTASNK